MFSLYENAVKIVQIFADFGTRVWTVFTTPLNTLLSGTIGGWIGENEAVRTIVDALVLNTASNLSLMEWMFTAGLGVMIIVAIIKFFLPTS